MQENDLGNNFIWIYAEKIVAQIISFVVTIVLARFIAPENYGIVSLVTIFITIANVFVEAGFGTALIQKKDADEADFSSTFFVGFLISVIIYGIMWGSAPFVEAFFATDGFALVFRVMGTRIIIGAFNVVQQAYISRQMKFKLSFFVSIVGAAFSAIIGIALACMGAGVWALVWQYLCSTVVTTILLYIVSGWHPKWIFSWESIKTIYSFGSKMLFASLLDAIYNNLRSLVIGKKYTSADLAYYNKADQFPQVIVASINGSIGRLLLPVMSREQDHRETVKECTRMAIRLSSFIMAPILVGMAVCSADIIELLLTRQWMEAAPLMAVLCIMYMLYPIHTANLQAILALGKSDVYMILEIIKKAIGIVFLCVALFVFDSVMAIAVSGLVLSLTAIVVNAAPNIWLLNYRLTEQFNDLLPSMGCAAVMGAAVYYAGSMLDGVMIRLAVRVLMGAVIYAVLSYFFAKKDFMKILTMGEKMIHKSRRK